MPSTSAIVSPSSPLVLERLRERPELAGSIYRLPHGAFRGLPRAGLLIAELPAGPGWRASDGPHWFEPDPTSYKPPAPIDGPPAPARAMDELRFEPADIERRFTVVRGRLPPAEVLRVCKALAREGQQPLAWYTYLDRGDTLYHDAAWIFGPRVSVSLAPGVTFETAGDDEGEDEHDGAGVEELVIYDGFDGPSYRGWLLWGNERAQSRHHDAPASSRLALRLGFSGSSDFPFDFPSYSNVTGDIWAKYRVG